MQEKAFANREYLDKFVASTELKLAKNYAFGGADAQRQFLESEGVVIKDNKVVINSGRE